MNLFSFATFLPSGQKKEKKKYPTDSLKQTNQPNPRVYIQ